MDTRPSIINVLFMDIGCFQPRDKWLWHTSLHTSTAISNESVSGRQTSELIDSIILEFSRLSLMEHQQVRL